MAKILIVAFLFLMTDARADWVELFTTSDGDSKFYIDKSTKKEGKYPQVSVLIKSSKPSQRGVQSRKILYEADCNQSKVRGLNIAEYTDRDAEKLLKRYDTSSEWYSAPPATFFQALVSYLCKVDSQDEKYKLCLATAENINKNTPVQIDNITIMTKVRCKKNTQRISLVYSYVIAKSIGKEDLPVWDRVIQSQKKEQIGIFCANPEAKLLLDFFDTEYLYSGENDILIGSLEIKKEDCSK